MNTASSVTSIFSARRTTPAKMMSTTLNDISGTQLPKSYEYLLKHLAGPLMPRVSRIFGGKHAPLYILTDPVRRQVWNACLAADFPKVPSHQLRRTFMQARSKDLLEAAYGSYPEGLLGFLRRIGDTAYSPDFYKYWHKHLTLNPNDFLYYPDCSEPWEAFTAALRNLPEPIRNLRFCQRFKNIKEMKEFVIAITAINGGTPSDSAWEKVSKQLYRGVNPLKMLQKYENSLHFPSPYIQNDARFRHLGTVKDLKATGLAYQNCMRSSFVIEAIMRGATQCYEFMPSEEPCVLSLSSDAPFGYRIDEILGIKNKDVSEETKAEVESALAEHGITERESVYEIIEQWEMRENPDQPQRFGHFGRHPF